MDIRARHGSTLPGGPQHTSPPPSHAPQTRPANPFGDALPLQPRSRRQNAAAEGSSVASAGQPALDRSPPVDLRAGQVPLERLRSLEALHTAGETETPATPPAPLRTGPFATPASTNRPQATGAGSSRPDTEKPNAVPIVPARLREKFEAIDLKKLHKLNQGLHQYAKHVIEKASTGMQPNVATLEMDKRHLPLLAEMENHRHPGLNLNVFSTPEKCQQAILDKQGEVQRDGQAAGMRIVYPPFPRLPDHHVALDVRFRPGRPPSIIIYESALEETVPAQHEALTAAITGAQVFSVANIIQHSHWDCVMFALNAALKSFKTQEVFAAGIHDPQGPETPRLPPEFNKHMHSKRAARKGSDANAIVTKDKTGNSTETLLQRVEAYSADRSINEVDEHIEYSTSIEGFRLQEIRRAGEYLAAKKSPKKSWFA